MATKTETKPATSNGAVKTEANGKATKTEKAPKKTFKEMTEKEKVKAAIKNAVAFSKLNGYKGIDIKVTEQNDAGEKVELAKDAVNYKTRFERLFSIKIYPCIKAKESKIDVAETESYNSIKALAVASLAEQKTKKYGKATQDLLNACLTLKGAKSERSIVMEDVSDWVL